nr:uncharacterized protein LOC128692280 [Cherax quadricarinatus]
MSVSSLSAALGLLVTAVVAQLPFTTIPTISDEIKGNALTGEAASFIRLWEYALEKDGQGPAPVNRINFEAKTILAPGTHALASLVHQDAAHPLYGSTTALTLLRRQFLLDHLVLEPLEPSDVRLDNETGVTLLTFSHKNVTITKDNEGKLSANGVLVENVTSLSDGTQIYILQETLFNNKEKVKVAFQRHNSFIEELNGPTGPPLDIPGSGQPSNTPVIRAPAPPPLEEQSGPPAHPSVIRGSAMPPAPPASNSTDANTFPNSQGQVRSLNYLHDKACYQKQLHGDSDKTDRTDLKMIILQWLPILREELGFGRQIMLMTNETVQDLVMTSNVGNSASSDYKTLSRAAFIYGFEIAHHLSDEKGPYIVLAPSGAAFSQLTRKELRQLSRGNDLAYHLIPLRGQPAPEVTNDSTFKTLLGPELRFNVYGNSVFVNGVAVSRGDLPFSTAPSSIPYVVDSVLEVPVGEIQAVLVGSGHSYSRVNTLLSASDLVQSGTYTLLAPPDSAITSKGYSWPGLLMNRGLRRDLLARHSIRGAWYSEGLLQQRTLATLAGTTVTFRKDLDGTVSANGIPLRSWNLTATNGVVHLAADVIPETDLGSDPTTIPNPLLSQTEAPIFSRYKLEDVVPSVPAVSGLYETPDHDPFSSFIRSPGAPSKTHFDIDTSGQKSYDSRHPSVPSFQEYMESLGFVSVPPVENNIYAQSDHIIQNGQSFTELGNQQNSEHSLKLSQSQQPERADTLQNLKRQPIETQSTEVITFLGKFDEPYEQHPKDDTFTQAGESSQFKKYGTRTTAISSTNVPTLPHRKNTYHDINAERNDVFAADEINRPLIETNQPHPQLYQENGINSSNILGVSANDGTSGINIQDFFNATHATGHETLFRIPGDRREPETVSEDQRICTNVSEHHVASVPIVPDGVTVWSPAGAVTEEERTQLDVLALLKRLNLTRFLEMVDRAGLTLTLSLDGPWTVFAPSNEAINTVPGSALQEIISSRRFLRRLVSYHLAPGRFTSGSSFGPGVHLPTLHAGHTLRLNYYTDGPVARWVAGGSIITDLDEGATNGIIHVLDRLLYAPYGDISTTLSLSPALTVFAHLLTEDLYLNSYLSELFPSTKYNHYHTFILQCADTEWVLSHVVEGAWYTAGFSNTWPLFSNANNTLITVLIDQDIATVNGVRISYADITASNGVIHVLESPLVTPT